MVRSFVALSIGTDVQESLARAQERLRAVGASVRWVPPENLHLTLKFLGDVEQERVADIAGALANAAEGSAPVQMCVAGLGAFPNTRRPRVVWAGVTDGAERVGMVAEAVQRNLEPLGFEPERRRFSAHITLGRVRSFVGVSGLRGVLEEHADTQFGTVQVRELLLMASDLKPGGAVYSVLARVPLGS